MSAGSAIAAQGLTKRYGMREVVRALSLEIERGAIFGFLGPNGSGKSTTIKMLCGLVRPSAGQGRVAGFDVATQGEQVRQSIGYMSQSFALYEDLTVAQNLEFYGRAYRLGSAQRERRAQEVARLTGVEPFLRQLAGTLSGGLKQRLALATALLHEPRVLFLDEPTAGIDPVARRELWDLLYALAQKGVTLFVTTHYMDEAERCSRVGYIYDGDLIACGTLEELRLLPGVDEPGTLRYRVETERVMEAFASSRSLPYVRDVTIFGRELHVIVRDDIAADRLGSDIGGASKGIGEVSRIDASLEDVFVALTRGRAKT
ncbi:MAG: ABC transporter ATP-binding protein [bacterium]|nr:ABC transporter ATP-binding protein [bacterium]